MLSPGAFNALLATGAAGGVGQSLLWSRASLCPCRNPVSGQAKQGCANCAGKGVIWAAAAPAWAGMAGMKSTREWAAFGTFESGDVVLSIPSDSPFYAAGEFDRAIMVNSSEPFNAVPTAVPGFKLQYPVISIDQCFWLDPATQAIVQGGIPVQADDRTLSWPDGGAPPAGMQFSVRGRKRPEYFLFQNFPSDRAHAGGLDLPRRVIGRRFDLFGR